MLSTCKIENTLQQPEDFTLLETFGFFLLPVQFLIEAYRLHLIS